MHFENYEALRAHRGSKHSAARKLSDVTFNRHVHGTDGMPTCSGCHHAFLRWVDLRKHIEGKFCQVQDPEQAVVQSSFLQKARSGDEDISDLSRVHVNEAWRQDLRRHCVICKQWMPHDKYIKIHYGRVHKQEWQDHQAVMQRWRKEQGVSNHHQCNASGVETCRSLEQCMQTFVRCWCRFLWLGQRRANPFSPKIRGSAKRRQLQNKRLH